MLIDPLARRRLLLRRAAALCAVMVLVVTSLSAFLRQSGAGLGCTPWPACYARAAQVELPKAAPSDAEHRARELHRVIASSLLLLLVAMAALALAGKPRLVAEGGVVALALGLVLFLAVLGVFTARAKVPAVTLGNLLGGMLLFAACVRAALAPAAMGEPARKRLRRWAWLAGVLLVLQAGLGALVSAGYAGLSCPELLVCNPGVDAWSALNPWHMPGAGAGKLGYAAGIGVQLLHRWAAFLVVAALIALALAAWRAGQRYSAGLLMGLAALQVVLGVTLVLAKLPLSAALGHNLLAVLLLGTVAALAARAAPLSFEVSSVRTPKQTRALRRQKPG